LTNYFKYLNTGAVEEKWGLYVTTVGYLRIRPRQSYPNNKEHPKSHSFNWDKGRILNGYYLVFISKGEGIFESALTKACVITEGTCFFLYPGIWHRYKPKADSGWEEYWIGFKGYYSEKLMTAGFFKPSMPFISVGMNRELLLNLQKLLETVRASSAGYHQVAAGITLQILGLLNAATEKENNMDDPIRRLISKSIFILQESFDTPVNIEKLAKDLPMGYSTFRRAFKKITGSSPNQYLLDLRLNKAKDLLLSTKLNINEIADQTGFDSIYYFSKLFKKKNAGSPTSFRTKKTRK
jgi:AraC-like DNA-binding protein